VLSPSLKSARQPVRVLANLLSMRSFNVFVPNNEDEAIDPEIIKGKIVFSTFH
jgi:hypothetical protein